MGLILKIFAGIVVGILLGLFAPMPVIKTLSSIGFVLGQYIRFVIPLLIIAFVAKGVAEFGKQAGKALLLGLVLLVVAGLIFTVTVLPGLFEKQTNVVTDEPLPTPR